MTCTLELMKKNSKNCRNMIKVVRCENRQHTVPGADARVRAAAGEEMEREGNNTHTHTQNTAGTHHHSIVHIPEVVVDHRHPTHPPLPSAV